MNSSSFIPSPLKTLLPQLSPDEAAKLAYPPYAIPGARDVETFYGSMRVYEWGPEDGHKVLFVHGDATPCLVFANIAHGLVDAGFRVMLFDLWGRGYSDTPLGVRHDVRLFANQVILALSSSKLSWVGNGNTFSIIGFSMGGPISLAFTGAFPESVRSVVLFGPAGLLRKLPEGYDNPVLYGPESAASSEAVREAVRQILGVEPSPPAPHNRQSHDQDAHQSEDRPSRVNQTFDMTAIFQWQFDHHQGHVHSFQDTVRYGPLQHMEHVWSKVCDIFAGKTRSDSPLHGSKLLTFFGQDDDVVVGSETVEDILTLLPPEHLQVEYLPGGHGFPYPNSETITRTILAFWTSISV